MPAVMLVLSRLRSRVALSIVLASLSLAATAAAQEPAPPVAQPTAPRAHVALSLERAGGISYSSLRPTDAAGSASITSFGLGGPAVSPLALPRVGIDVLLPGGLTLGAGAAFGAVSYGSDPDRGESSSVSGRGYLLAPRVGYRVGVAPWLDVTPRAGVSILGGSITGPEGRSCVYAADGSSSCTSTPGETLSLFAVAASAELVAAFRVTRSFNVLAGLAYDHVVAASSSSKRTRGSVSTARDEEVEGRYLGGQLWLGLGGYF